MLSYEPAIIYIMTQQILTNKREMVKYNVSLNGFTAIELFAGAGGLALGTEKAGFDTLALIEVDKNAAAARGTTVIRRIYHIARGYEKLEMKLRDLGVDVRRRKYEVGLAAGENGTFPEKTENQQ